LDNARHETVIYSFKGGSDGGIPLGVVMDGAGNLYGATQLGGPAYLGAVFKLDTAGKETALNALTGGVSGNSPQSGLIRDNGGNLYGTTFYGGPGNGGVLYKMGAGHEMVLYNFSGGTGLYPSGSIVRDAAGNIYGTAVSANGCCGPLVYKLTNTGQETVLATFGDNDGLNPGVIMDPAGNLYVTTSGGSAGGGAVYKISPSGQTTVLYSFTGGTDGGSPWGNVTLDAAGNLYGTTASGGTAGCGIVFKLSPSSQETVLYNFTLTAGVDGGAPYAGVTLDSAGDIYGTTGWGGTPAMARCLSWTPPAMKPSSTALPRNGLVVRSSTRLATSMEQRMEAAVARPVSRALDAARFTRWTRPVSTLCCTASRAETMGERPLDPCSSTVPATSLELQAVAEKDWAACYTRSRCSG
jgi:uncharacterized repeat protein (TIGR03803 family)